MINAVEPIRLFSAWLSEEIEQSKVRIPTAVCLSTIGIDNFPNARFVSLKEVVNSSFIITGPLNSRKGYEIANNEKVALTFWWTETERQIRIQGIASKVSEKDADKYFDERSENSKAVSVVCEQGMELKNFEELKMRVQEEMNSNEVISRPNKWGAYSIEPMRIEFMEFSESRFHDRKLFEIKNGEWTMKHIQP